MFAGLKGAAEKLSHSCLHSGSRLLLPKWHWGWRMSNVFMQEVLRISDRYLSESSSGYFKQVFVLVLVFHMIMGICFMRMHEYERAHPRPVYDVDVSYLAAELPRDVELAASVLPAPGMITPGDNPDSGSESASDAFAEKLTLKSFKEEKQSEEQKQHDSKSRDAIKETRQGPVSIYSSKEPKMAIPEQLANRPGGNQDGSHSQQIPAGSFSDGGKPGGTGSSSGDSTGIGVNGKGKGASASGDGSADGNEGGKEIISTHIETVRGGMFNIAPYRLMVLKALVQYWHPSKKMNDNVTVSFEINRDGEPFDVRVVSSCGDRKLDKEAVAAAEQCTFPPLPEVLKYESLRFEIEMGQSVQ